MTEPMQPTRRQALISLALLLPVPSLGVLAGTTWWPGTPLGQALFVAAKVWVFALPLVWHLFVERQRVSLSPLRAGGLRVALTTGALIGLVVVGGYVAFGRALIPADALRETVRKFGLDSPLRFFAGAAYWIGVNSLLEEYVWRWFVVQQAARLAGTRAAIALSALGFAAHHVLIMRLYFSPPLVVLAGLAIAFAGGLWSWMYARYRSVWPGYLSHALVDLAVFAVGYALLFG